MSDAYQRNVFAGHPLGTPPLGTPETVAALTAEAVRDQRRRLWGGANLVLGVAGRITTADALGRAGDAFGALPAGRAPTCARRGRRPAPAGRRSTRRPASSRPSSGSGSWPPTCATTTASPSACSTP